MKLRIAEGIKFQILVATNFKFSKFVTRHLVLITRISSLSLHQILITMIQRIQSVYLAISIILLSFVALGADVFRFVGKHASFVFDSYGIGQVKLGNGDGLMMVSKYPLYVGLIALVLLLFITLMGYKNLKRQLKLVRTAFYIYVLILLR